MTLGIGKQPKQRDAVPTRAASLNQIIMKSEFGKLLMGIYTINIYLDWSGRTSFGVNLTNALTFCAVGISLTFVEKKNTSICNQNGTKSMNSWFHNITCDKWNFCSYHSSSRKRPINVLTSLIYTVVKEKSIQILWKLY